MLIELGRVEQRHAAVLEVMGGLPVTEVALRYGVARQTVHRWLRRYAAGGIGALADASPRPVTCPHQVAPHVEARIVELRDEHPCWGPRTIAHHLAREAVSPLPSRSSIYRCPVRHHLIAPQKRRRQRSDYRRWERSRAMELWQMDVMGGVRLEGGREAKIVTGIDDHSRFCVCAQLTPRATARPVCEALTAAMRRYGTPEQILTDNGRVFTARFGRGTGMVLFDRLCAANGVRHLLTAPRSPTTTGKIERFHQSLRREFLAGRSFASAEEAQAAVEAFVADYNTRRPHQALEMATPAQRFRLRPIAKDASCLPVDAAEDHHGQWVLRRVGSNGVLSVDNQLFSVANAFKGELVDVFVDETTIQVWSKNHLVKTVARKRSGPVRKVRADGLHVKHQPDTKRQASAGT